MRAREFYPSHFMATDETVRKIQRRFVDYFPEGGTVADLGCGVGVFLDLLRKSGRNGIGVDHLEYCVSRCREQGLEAVQQNVFEFLRLHPGQLDGIMASHLIEHFSTSDGLELLQLMVEALKPNGVVFIMTPSYHDVLVSSERFWLDVSHVRPYPLRLLDAIFQHVGLTVIDQGYDPVTKVRPGIIHPRSFYRWLIGKIRFGKLYDVGDAFIVGRKP